MTLKQLIFITSCFLTGTPSFSQTNYIALLPADCPNCLKSIEYIGKEHNIFIMPETYSIDSTDIKKRYLYSNKAPLLFSDSLFNLYSINGRSAISNKNGTLKCLSSKYDNIAHDHFIRMNKEKIDQDTLAYEYPLSKRSILKYEFTPQGKVYLLNSISNNVILYDLLHDEMADTIRLDDRAKQDAYTLFSINDTAAYEYYKTGLQQLTRDELSTINDIAFYKDTLYLSVSNYFFYFRDTDGEDTAATHFQSIAVYTGGKYITSYVPTDIKEMLIDSTVKFHSELLGLYKYENNIYTGIYNTRFHEDGVDYAVGRYNPTTDRLTWISKLTEEFNNRYDFSRPLYSGQFYVLQKSTKLYNIETSSRTDLNYFKQDISGSYLGIPGFPKYCNQDINVDDNYYNILYYATSEEQYYYARIDKKTNKVVQNKLLSGVSGDWNVKIDPYNNNFVFCFYDNNKIIRHKVFDEDL